jgi:hypothetical protein
LYGGGTPDIAGILSLGQLSQSLEIFAISSVAAIRVQHSRCVDFSFVCESWRRGAYGVLLEAEQALINAKNLRMRSLVHCRRRRR